MLKNEIATAFFQKLFHESHLYEKFESLTYNLRFSFNSLKFFDFQVRSINNKHFSLFQIVILRSSSYQTIQ